MRLEIHSAANFLVHLVRLHHRNGSLSDPQLEMFKRAVTELLRRRYRDHWFPERPTRGSGYRCIRINGKMDPVIAQAGIACGVPEKYLHRLFPTEFTMWIDPLEVSYRIGENGSICVLYEGASTPAEPEFLNPLPNSPVKESNNNSGGNNSCKESLRQVDFFMDQRSSGVSSFEQLATYVSS